jgi:hypothetical protein
LLTDGESPVHGWFQNTKSLPDIIKGDLSMGIGVGINGENSGYIGVVTIVDYFSTLSLPLF